MLQPLEELFSVLTDWLIQKTAGWLRVAAQTAETAGGHCRAAGVAGGWEGGGLDGYSGGEVSRGGLAGQTDAPARGGGGGAGAGAGVAGRRGRRSGGGGRGGR